MIVFAPSFSGDLFSNDIGVARRGCAGAARSTGMLLPVDGGAPIKRY